MRQLACIALLGLAACSGSPLGGGGGDHSIAVADVSGRVFLASGALATRGTVTIRCGLGVASVEAPVGTEGQYASALQVPRTVVGGSSGGVDCTFTATDAGTTVASLAHRVGFGPPGLPHLNQLVDLHQQP